MDRPSAVGVLARPSVVASFALLVLNDHVLKGHAPGWLTAKLSDLVGLYAVPLLVAVIVRRFVSSRREAGIVGIALTGAAFALVELVPAADGLAEDVLGLLAPAGLTPDRTDLVCLVALLPAWRTWQLSADAERSPVAGAVGRVVASAGLVAVMATSSIEPEYVRRIAVVDGVAYADGGLYGPDGGDVFVRSADGVSWEIVDGPAPAAVLDRLRGDVQVEVTDPAAPERTYRLVPGQRVEERVGGGEWRTSFEIPDGRRLYQSRRRQGFAPWFSIGGEGPGRPSRGFTDLAALPTESGTMLLVPMGNEGLARRNPAGQWERLPLLDGTPTPLEGGLHGLRWELLLPVGIMATYLVTFAAFGWSLLPPLSISPSRAGRDVTVLALVAIAVAACAVLWRPGVLLIGAGGVLWAILRSGVVRLLALAGVVLPIAAATPWALWSAGAIDDYAAASRLGVVILGAGTVAAVASLWHMVRRARSSPAATE